MDIETVRNLIQLMVDNELAELEVQDGETRVVLKRQGEQISTEDLTAMAARVVAAREAPSMPPQPAAESHDEPEPAADEDANTATITSPMVGTFYAAPDPDTPPFVQVGSEVQPDTVVCIIEAMKVYNEIKAETYGVIEKVLVKNEDPLEFGQALFVVRPTA